MLCACVCRLLEIGGPEILLQSGVEKEVSGGNRKKIRTLRMAGIQKVIWLLLNQDGWHLQNSGPLGAQPLCASFASGTGGQRLVPTSR